MAGVLINPEHLNEDRRRFYALAAAAIRGGLLTVTERDVICRTGTRKAGYWARHLRDLRAVLAERRERATSKP
jgi:hypothetical protein